ncbi:10076_t:CDS:2, partial [Dentiscutata heterogama]
MADINNVETNRNSTLLEGLAINGQLTLNKLINTIEEIFATLATSSSENTEQKVAESRNKYKNVSDELRSASEVHWESIFYAWRISGKITYYTNDKEINDIYQAITVDKKLSITVITFTFELGLTDALMAKPS